MRTVRICGVSLAQCAMLWVRFGKNIGAHALLLCMSHANTVLSKHEVGIQPLFRLVFWDCGCACARGRGGRSAFGFRLHKNYLTGTCLW